MSIRLIFAWYDLWIGVFIDRHRGRVYVFPAPCIGFVIERRALVAAAKARKAKRPTPTHICHRCGERIEYGAHAHGCEAQR